MGAMFDLPAVPGLSIRDDFITAAEQAQLIAQIDETDLSPFVSSNGPTDT